MKIIILIILFCWLLHRKGTFDKLLTACELDDMEQIERSQKTETENHPPTERQRLEMQARIVVSQIGENPDTVVYMGDGLLQALINDYTRENKK
jgi:hypothetical protein